MTEVKKPIKIHWVAPNGKEYQDVIPMTLDQYTYFVENLMKMKHEKQIPNGVEQ